MAFAGTVTGEDWSVSTEFGFKGEVDARAWLAGCKSKPEALKEEAKKMGIYATAFNSAWPVVTAMMLKAYKDNNWLEWKVYGEEGSGYRTLERGLEATGEHYRGFRSPIATWK